MKRTLILLAFSCLFVVAFAQKNYTTDEIRTGWAKKTITGVKSGNILPLLTAFNNTWRTAPATAILKDGTNPAAQDNEYHFVVDTPNGFVSAGELGDDGEDLQACVWKRSNGHKLFAVVYTRTTTMPRRARSLLNLIPSWCISWVLTQTPVWIWFTSTCPKRARTWW